MIKIEFNHTDYRELLQYYAEVFNGRIKNNKLQLPSEVGEGFIKLIELPNGLQGLVSDYTVHQDLLLNRTKINKDYFTLRFDEVTIPEAAPVETDSEILADISPVRSAVFLGSTKFDWMFLSTKGTRVKGVNILFSKEWLEQFLEVESVGDLIKKYLSLT